MKETKPVSSYSSTSFFFKQEDHQELSFITKMNMSFFYNTVFSNHDFVNVFVVVVLLSDSFFFSCFVHRKESLWLLLLNGCKLTTFGIKRMDCICILDKACMLQYRRRVSKLHNILYFCKLAFSNMCVR